MKNYLIPLLPIALLAPGAMAQQGALPDLKDIPPKDVAARILESSEELAEVQDELSADVMELVESQTVPQVIELLEEVEKIMAEVTDDLVEGETGGPTMAAQTEIIEKILAAAKKKQESSGESSPESQESMGAMLDMMERMMGKEPGDQQGPPKEGETPSDKGDGGGSTGDSDSSNQQQNGAGGENDEVRVIPKGSAPSGRGLPNEFRKLLDAYNRNDTDAPSK
ncbi:hypothetical protein [Roseibacillus persicicus]|uniref:Secreted protein n=1 Tax=Roseibacillus persicicus TaxID=454148 RepID=A0A918TKN3_9BACT|nr:hypothetical protein [Roseibacillus persicicus]GHC51901.1 hypothetical protein GCM10007100_17740 [Roseibacillus persicicus]